MNRWIQENEKIKMKILLEKNDDVTYLKKT